METPIRNLLLAGAAALIGASGGVTTAQTPATGAASAASAPAPVQLSAETQEVLRTNPVIREWTGPYGGVPPWDQVRPEHFPPAFGAGIDARQAEYDAIASNPAPPTFANTFVPMQDAGRALGRTSSLFGVMTGNMNSPEYQKLEAEWSPKLTAAANRITFNRPLFGRIEAIYNAREQSGLTAERQRLVERTYQSFVRSGARLTPEQQAQVGRINEQLSARFAEFSKKILADENTWIVVDGEPQLAGLPASQRGALKAAAEERGLAGKWAIVNTRSVVDPFLTFSENRHLRERVWKAFKERGDGTANDTSSTITEILRLRAERAKLLGFPTHAHFRMDDTMAGDPERAQELMMRVWPAATARVREEVADMQKIAAGDGVQTFEPWDYLYYAEKVRKARYDLDTNEVKEYFSLQNMIDASYWTAERLYGITFTEITGQVPVWHPDVRVYEVKDKADGAHRGLFYRDDFARPGKRSGAWASSYRQHETFTGKRLQPLASNNNNFVKPGAGEPVLISLDDAETLFHEFGHALHTLLSEVNYPGLGVTPRDFVEYPSQVMEHWVLTRPVLDRFAKHYQSGQPMPQALVDKIKAAETFNQGYATTEYLSAALVDMALHNRAEPVTDIAAFERETLQRLGMPREVAMRHRLPQFNHLFSSDAYSAGYYSYLWSEVMDADTWAAFEESGNVFDPALAERMRRYILAPGNTTDRAEAFRQFRGRDPDVTALLKVRGFPTGGAGSN